MIATNIILPDSTWLFWTKTTRNLRERLKQAALANAKHRADLAIKVLPLIDCPVTAPSLSFPFTSRHRE